MKIDGTAKQIRHSAVAENHRPGPVQKPGERLYIYYLEGVPQSPLTLGPDFIGNWQEGDSAFLFFRKPAPDTIDQLVRTQTHLTHIDLYRMSYNEWQGVLAEGFVVGDLYFRPPWVPSESKAQYEIVLDPGVVFGNGNHTTTRDCITALQSICKRWSPKRVLDLGCGTGILALAAARLSAEHVLAVDLNRLAVNMTRRNILYNELGQKILAVHASAENVLSRPADLLIANIHFAVMQKIIRQQAFKQHRHLLLSGLLRSELKAVESELAARAITCLQHWSHDGIWHTILCHP